MSQKLKLSLAHLYPEEMNLYGDFGNVLTLQRRAEWRGIKFEVAAVGLEERLVDLTVDMYFFGGGQDQDQLLIYPDLVKTKAAKLKADIHSGVPVLAICGGYQLLGEYFLDADGNRIDGIGALPLETVSPGPGMDARAVGNLATSAQDSIGVDRLVGFENHSGRTRFKSDTLQPLGNVLSGSGDNEDQLHEGVIFGGCVGSYMHGPLLPKNPQLADYLLTKALERKYGQEFTGLEPLDDTEEIAARDYMLTKLGVSSK